MNTESSSQSGQSGSSASRQLSADRNGSIPTIDVVLATHDDLLRSELRAKLEDHGGFVVAAEKTNATQALGATLFHSPRVCLLAIDLPGELEARIESIRAERPETRIGILAHSADQPGLLRAVLAGADGVLLTSGPTETFMAELGALSRGDRVIPPEESAAAAEANGRRTPAAADEARLALLESNAPSLAAGNAPKVVVVTEPSKDGWLKATLLYLPRFLRHLRRRLRARMSLPTAWTSARERMADYR